MRKILLLCSMMLIFASLASANSSLAMFSFTYPPYELGDVELQTNNGNIVSTMTGWYDQTGSHGASNPDYIVGLCGTDSCHGGNDVFNDFFVFNVPSGTYTSAVISAYLPGPTPYPGYYGPASGLTYQLFDVSTPLAQVMSDNTGRTDIYTDLGSGVLYGTALVTPGEMGTQVLITLDPAALASINAASGGLWGVGGSIYGAAIPEPATLLLLSTGLGVIGLAAWRKRR